MNQSFAITLGQFLSFIALGIGFSFGLYFCGEAIVRECKRWGKWREARRLVQQAEATEAMKAWRDGQGYRRDAGTTESSLLREMQQLNDLMGGKK